MNSPIAVRISIQLFVAAAFLAVFGALNSSQYGTSLVPSILLAAVCVGAGFAVRTGTPNGRLIGLVASCGTVVYGVISLFGHHYLPGSVVLEVQDRGIGFGNQESKGMGLISMRERAELVNGRVEFLNAEGGGTLIRLTVPC